MIMITNFNIAMMMMILPTKSGARMINNDHDHHLQNFHDDDDPAEDEWCSEDQR